MPQYSNRSLENLTTCHPLIKAVAHEVIKWVDVMVEEGWRSRRLQNEYFEEGLSKVRWPNSKHNNLNDEGLPESHAAHFLPYPELWQASMRRWYYVGGFITGVGETLVRPEGWHWRWGGDWDGDDIFSDQGFDDLAHHEIVRME